jgi:hypothetical protein
LSLTPGAEFTQTSNVVHFDVCLRLAEFATAGHEPVDEFCGTLPPDHRKFVFEALPASVWARGGDLGVKALTGLDDPVGGGGM